MRPPDFTQPLYKKDLGITSGEDRWSFATANSTSRSGDSDVLVWNATSPMRLTGSAHHTKLRAAAESEWTISGHDQGFVKSLPVPLGQIEGQGLLAEAQLVGNFTLFMDSARLYVAAQGQSAQYESGNWTEPVGAAPPGSAPPSRYRYSQTLRLTVTNGSLALAAQGHQAMLLAKEITCVVGVHASFDNAKGRVEHRGQVIALEKSRLEISNASSLRAWNESKGGDSLYARLEAPPAALGIGEFKDPGEPGSNGPTVAAPGSSSPWMQLVAGAAALSGMVFFALVANRRRRHVRIDDVEWALFDGRPRRARRLAGRLLRSDPRNVDALFLYGTTFLVRNEFRALIENVEPRAARLGAGARSGTAFLLAVAARKTGDRSREARWAAEAAKEPLLRRQLERDGLWQSGGAVPLQTGYA